MNQPQLQMIEYLCEENRVPSEHLGQRRFRLRMISGVGGPVRPKDSDGSL